MSRLQSGNFGKARGEAAATDGTMSYMGFFSPPVTPSSFSLVNQGPIAILPVDQRSRVRHRGLDSDMLYDLPEDSATDPASPKRRKKNSVQQYLGKPYMGSLRQDTISVLKNEISHPALPISIGKKSLRRPQSFQTELFPKAIVRKSLREFTKWTTTEEALKTSNVTLGITTLENLASFQYQQPKVILSENQNSHIREPHKFTSDLPFLASDVQIDAVNCDNGLPRNNCKAITASPIIQNTNISLEGGSNDHIEIFPSFSNMDHESGEEFPVEAEDEVQMAHLLQVDQIVADEFPVDDDDEAQMERLALFEQNKIEGLSIASSLEKFRDKEDHECTRYPTSSSEALRTLSLGSARTSGSRIISDSASLIVQNTLDGFPEIMKDETAELSTLRDHCSNSTIENIGRGTPITPATSYVSGGLISVRLPKAAMKPFARPKFPTSISDRSLINGVSTKLILRTCFRIGEACKIGALGARSGQDFMIELFAMVVSSRRDVAASKQSFELADVFHGRPPFIRGVLDNYQTSSLQALESRVLEGDGLTTMVRCLGRLSRAMTSPPSWVFHLSNIRKTDWEEIRWASCIAGAGMAT